MPRAEISGGATCWDVVQKEWKQKKTNYVDQANRMVFKPFESLPAKAGMWHFCAFDMLQQSDHRQE